MKRIIGFTNGCWDMFHVGHLHIIKEAKKLCDELHVGINSDSSVLKLKGKGRPIFSQDERFEILSAIKYVNRVYIFDEPTPIKLIEKIMPDIIVKGGDYNLEDVVGGSLAKVVIVPLFGEISTSSIIRKIKLGK